ncbi:tryptophan halogenase family protein [Gilvimarinus algae]|uniref:Tryptophan 7-halogenase n=1 Tax=Gilvimarinus algae TaxID=3058037 RepID=A0ABT8TAZ1_9GAMM|nr:tryptophan halogenase family protein [Gilvimarinus sp. SDUM040014]MDO3381286.1 tryptophan 7-halogenase [Gilvimarinus sp. SDUM040014]
MNNTRIKKVVIAGGGTAGWMAAALISKSLGRGVELTLVESDAIPTVGVGEATIPPIINFHKVLDLGEKEFLSRVNGTFKLGISFEGWHDLGKDYVHSFGFAGKSNWAAEFHHFWVGAKKRGIDVSQYGDYCAEHLAARMKKFAVVPKNGVNYAYHLDAGLYAKFLREVSEKYGAVRKEGTIAKVNLDQDDGSIKSILLESGETVEGDLFVDCTGFRALLIGEALGTGYDDWSHWLPCNSAVAAQTELTAPPLPYTRSIARPFGWQWRIPLQNRAGNGLVFSSDYLSDEDAKTFLAENVDGKLLTDPRVIKFTTGSRKVHWKKNCVAIGLSSGFLEPLESTSIHLIQRSITRLVQLFPSNGIKQSQVDEFNQQCRDEIESIRDFIILHYHVTDRDDSDFWRYCRTMDVPDSLSHRIKLFKETGKIFKKDLDLFAEESWVQVMMGQGLMPDAYHPVVDTMADDSLGEFLKDTLMSTKQKVERLPEHHEFIEYYCKSTVV